MQKTYRREYNLQFISYHRIKQTSKYTLFDNLQFTIQFGKREKIIQNLSYSSEK